MKQPYNTTIYNTALYLRLSRDDELQGESGSIQTQRMMLRQYAAEHGLTVVDEYIDDGWSGTNFERPSFQRMIDDIEDGKINCVVTKDLSRLGRNYILTGQYTEIYFPSKGVRYIAINDNVDTINGESELAATYKLTSDTALVTGKTYYTKSGTKYNAVASPSVDNIATYYEVDAPAGEEYTSYVLGEGSINFEDLGAKVPYEMSRDPAKNGGQDTLYTRQRKVFAPKGISYEKTSQTTLSPTDAELSNGANWALVHSGEATESQRSYINHKVIPIARIKSRG